MNTIDLSRRRFGRQAAALATLPLLNACVLDNLTAVETDYRDAVQQVVDSYGLPGALAGVRITDKTPWTRAFGQASVSPRTAMALGSTFPIRDITTSFTVTLLLLLVRDGVLALDHTIGRYVAGVPNGTRITLAHLASQQSGLVDYTAQDAFVRALAANPLRVWAARELAAFALARPAAFLPGAQYQYSATNAVLLGMVVELVTGASLADVLALRILSPSVLSGTAVPATATLPDPHPTPYTLDLVDGSLAVQPFISPTALAGMGAMSSTLDDLLTWGELLGTGSLIGTALQETRTAEARLVTNGPEYTRYGLGIGQIGTWWGHTGSGFGFQVAAMHDADAKATIAVMVNATPEGGRADLNFAQAIFEALATVVAGR